MMDAKTAEALEKSIQHWDELTRVESMLDVKIGPSDCALCGLFNPAFKSGPLKDGCTGCPVDKITDGFGCDGTPYEACEEIWNSWDGAEPDNDTDAEYLDRFRAAATAERDFLISLRDKA